MPGKGGWWRGVLGAISPPWEPKDFVGEGQAMNSKTIPLNRRVFLRGAGVSLALPWFETFAGAAPAGGAGRDLAAMNSLSLTTSSSLMLARAEPLSWIPARVHRSTSSLLSILSSFANV